MIDIPENKLFHSLDQLRAELFIVENQPPEEGILKEGGQDEAEVLVNKLIDDLLKKPRSDSND